MKINLVNRKKKRFKPLDLVMTFETKDELLAFITLLDNTEIQTWSEAPELCKALKELCDKIK